MKVIVTGFEPFNHESINPSQAIVEALPNQIKDKTIIKVIEPVALKTSAVKLAKVIADEQPDYVLCLGQAGGRNAISVERVALNLNDFRIPDNDGNQPLDEVINSEGPTAYLATLPIKRIVKELRDAGFKAEISNSAGTFVCNYLMYAALDLCADSNIKAGFVHVPYADEQQRTPSMPLAAMIEAVKLIIETIDCQEIKSIEGKIA